MPELPEVEVVRLRLNDIIVNRTIAEVRTARANYVFLTSPEQLKARLRGRRFCEILRHGKYLLLSLDDKSRFLIHLGMTGQLLTSHAASPRLHNARSRLEADEGGMFTPDQHTHLTVSFADTRGQLHFRDCRKFGKLLWLPEGTTDPRLERLGVDALAITATTLIEAGAKRRIPVKSLLLDQSVLAGVGNIYADEALFQAHLAPLRPACSLNPQRAQALARAIRRVLRKAIERGGSTIDDYVHPDGSEGQFQNSFSVYGREGKACRRCRTPIQRVVIGQRSSHFCPKCQD
jgi:formamidopyrimidine-DNA glycosylase